MVLREAAKAWVADVRKVREREGYLRELASQIVVEFLKNTHKNAALIAEVALLGHVLDRKDYRSILSSLIGQLEREPLTDVDLLRGLVQFLVSAPSGCVVDDDFVRILRVLRQQLKDTYKALGDANRPASGHIYHLSTAISRVLDAMIESDVHSLSRTEDHRPLLDLLVELEDCRDPFVKFQAKYAWQALQYVGEDESPLQALLRFGGGVTKAVLGIASVFKLDPESLCNGLQELSQAAGEAYDVVKAGLEGVQALRAGGEGAVDSMLQGFRSGAKKAWYPALQGARVFIREGQLADFERVVHEAPCRGEPEFQWGVCQLLGEMAVDPIWAPTSQQALHFLKQLHQSDTVCPSIKDGILEILTLPTNMGQLIRAQAAQVLQSLSSRRIDAPSSRPYPLVLRLPLPIRFPLLNKALKVQTLESNLRQLQSLRLSHHQRAVYIPPQAKASFQDPDEEAIPLMDSVKDFLESERQVFLIVGDSGSGKSTFSLHLENVLWNSYKQGDHRVPLYIHLPALQRPVSQLIDEQLMKYSFDSASIQELKQDRQFIVICDGYDEARLTANLHSSNGLNRPLSWDTKMIVSCRSTHLGREYHTRFQPQPSSPYDAPLSHLYQEAVIVPFSQEQVEDYIEQFLKTPKVHVLFVKKDVLWSAQEYLEMFERIPNLTELVKNPFLLTLALRALPDVVTNEGPGGASPTAKAETEPAIVEEMTRSRLLKAFVNQWLETNKRRLTTLIHLQGNVAIASTTISAVSTLQELIDEGFQDIALDFLQSLAGSIYKHQHGKPVVEYWHRQDKSTWKADFFGPEMDITLLRESSPLTRAGNLNYFIHRSFLEYFYACHLARTDRPRFGFKNPAVVHQLGDSNSNSSSNCSISSNISGSARSKIERARNDVGYEYDPGLPQSSNIHHQMHRFPRRRLDRRSKRDTSPAFSFYSDQPLRHLQSRPSIVHTTRSSSCNSYPDRQMQNSQAWAPRVQSESDPSPAFSCLFYPSYSSYSSYSSDSHPSYSFDVCPSYPCDDYNSNKLNSTGENSGNRLERLDLDSSPYTFNDGPLETLELERDEPEVLQFLVERVREDSAYAEMLRVYVDQENVGVEGVSRRRRRMFGFTRGVQNAKKILELAGGC
jgi:energy-coupling factor transporter ATP-binding protein EcfA2